MNPFAKLINFIRTCICLLFFCPALSESQTISAVSFPSSKQLGLTDTIRINTTAETPNSGASFDSYSLNYDTIVINLKHCISYLDFYGIVTIKTKIPPKPAGKYKVKINLMTFNSIWNPSCNIEYERHTWYDSIEVNAKYTSLFSEVEDRESLIVYPNPSEGKAYIDLRKVREPTEKLEIVNYTGQLIFCQKMPTGKIEIDLSAYPKGIYYCMIQSRKGQKTQKILKE